MYDPYAVQQLQPASTQKISRAVVGSGALWVLFIVFSLGAGVGVFFGARAIIDAITTLTDSFWLALYLGIVAGLLLCLVHTISLFRNNFAQGKSNRIWPVLRIDGIILAIAVLLAAAFVQPEGVRPWLPGAVLCAMVFFGILLLIIARASQRTRDWFRNWIFNPAKGFGGAAFADVANFVAVVGAVGVHAGFTTPSSLEGWYWLGQFGALLAFASGLSLLARWATLTEDVEEEAKNLVPGLFTVGIVLVTLFALELGRPDSFESLLPRLLVLVPWAVVLVFGLGVCGKLRDSKVREAAKPWGTALLIVLMIFTVAYVCLLLIEPFATEPTGEGPGTMTALILTAIAMGLWVAAEGKSGLVKTFEFALGRKSWADAVFYQEWEKNHWEMLSGVTIIFYIIARLVVGKAGAQTPALTIILVLGICCGLFGALRGVIVGIIEKHAKKSAPANQEDRAIQEILRYWHEGD